MKSGKTGNKAAACSVCHRLISTIECEFRLGPAVPLCVTVLGLHPQPGGVPIPAETWGQLKGPLQLQEEEAGGHWHTGARLLHRS